MVRSYYPWLDLFFISEKCIVCFQVNRSVTKVINLRMCIPKGFFVLIFESRTEKWRMSCNFGFKFKVSKLFLSNVNQWVSKGGKAELVDLRFPTFYFNSIFIS